MAATIRNSAPVLNSLVDVRPLNPQLIEDALRRRLRTRCVVAGSTDENIPQIRPFEMKRRGCRFADPGRLPASPRASPARPTASDRPARSAASSATPPTSSRRLPSTGRPPATPASHARRNRAPWRTFPATRLDSGASDAFRFGESERLPDVDHRFRRREVADLGGTVQDGHFIVVFERAIAERLENTADAPHAEAVQFRRAQRAHAGAAEDGNALGDRPQNFLMPDRRARRRNSRR